MTHFFNNINQYIRSQMWLLLINNFFRCAGSYETLQYLMITSVRIFYQRVQLSVGKGAGAALSELYVRFRVQNAGFPERIDTFLSLFCRFAALQNERTVAMLCENIGTKKPCRTASDNNRPVNKSLFSGFWEHI